MKISKKLIARELFYVLILIVLILLIIIKETFFRYAHTFETVVAFLLYAYVALFYIIRILWNGFTWALKTLNQH